MKQKPGLAALVALILLGITVASCQINPTPTQEKAQPTKPTYSVTSISTPPPTAIQLPVRNGAWVDELIFTEQIEPSAAVSRILGGEIDIYANALSDPTILDSIKSNPNLAFVQSVGSSIMLTLNPTGPEFSNGKLNPFNDPRIREAMNWLIDRDYIAKEIFNGQAVPRTVPISSFLPDYARYIDIIQEIEVKYPYDKEKANQVIADEMARLGANMGSDGKWQYRGIPVVITGLIRREDNRLQMGDYISNQLESIGFSVDRQYADRNTASAKLLETDPKEGQWSFYTYGWMNPGISRDESWVFGWWYTPLGSPALLWQSYSPSEQFMDVAQRLWNSDYKTLAERRDLFTQALPLAVQDSAEVMLIDCMGSTIMNSNIDVSYDLASGVSGSMIYPYTVRINGSTGGSVTIAQPGILVDPWNPVAGSGWLFDNMPQRATIELGTIADPYTGLSWPLRIEKASVLAKDGLPITKTLDWLTLRTSPVITVPSDAWVDWDAKSQTFITAGEKYTQTLESNTKVTITYPSDLFKTGTWHDGSPISPADFMMKLIMLFDQAKTDSQIFDESMVPQLDSFLSHLKGIKFLSLDPLVFEVYDDAYYLDAENLVSSDTFFPNAPWHTLAMGYLAASSDDINRELAYSNYQATSRDVEWMSFIDGPSLDILNGWVMEAASENYVPYAPTMAQYISGNEIAQRWSNLQQWYSQHQHFWIGTGPFFLDHVYSNERMLTLKRFENYPYPASRWARFGSPMMPSVKVDGPKRITAGEAPQFDIYVTFENLPYPTDQIDEVKFLVFDASKSMVTSGVGELYSEGHYLVILPKEVTSSLEKGTSILKVVVTSKAVSIPVILDVELILQSP